MVAQADEATGVITRSTDTGMMIGGFDGWFNRSMPQYDKTQGAGFPSDGSEVKVWYTTARNGKRYVEAFQLLSDARRQAAEQTGASPTRVQQAVEADTGWVEVARSSAGRREQSIERQTALKAAVEAMSMLGSGFYPASDTPDKVVETLRADVLYLASSFAEFLAGESE